jgi:sugar lactone lactonase YvrE
MRVIPVPGVGPEDVVVDARGRIITGVEDGRIWRLSPDGLQITQLADTGGRPLGIELFADGALLVCDAQRGLLRVDPSDGEIEVLASEGIGVCNNAAIGSDGTVYFSDSSQRFGLEHWRADLLEHSGTGRLLRRTPDGSVDVLADGLQFANGVALGFDESFYRLSKLWLTGEHAGRIDVMIDNLPGFPDNISSGADGLVWVALPAPRNAVLDRLHRLPPAFRKAAWALPERLQPQPGRTVWVISVDGAGNVVHDLQGDGDRFHEVTGVREHDGRLYLGSLVESAIAVLDLVEP